MWRSFSPLNKKSALYFPLNRTLSLSLSRTLSRTHYLSRTHSLSDTLSLSNTLSLSHSQNKSKNWYSFSPSLRTNRRTGTCISVAPIKRLLLIFNFIWFRKWLQLQIGAFTLLLWLIDKYIHIFIATINWGFILLNISFILIFQVIRASKLGLPV